MATPSTSAAALKLEIERLKGAINRHKTGETAPRPPTVPTTTYTRPRSNVYVNPNYKPPAPRPALPVVTQPRATSRPPASIPQEPRDVVIDGVAFESSGRSLVRKDLPKLPPKPPLATTLKPIARPPPPQSTFVRNKAGTMLNANRTYKPKTSRRGRPMNRNMTLTNNRRPYQSRRMAAKKAKYSDKPCPRFTSTGACNRGLTCMYQHDPNKVAICWAFLKGNCPNSAETCPLSHDPTPERTPLCVHFANNGRCTRAGCPFPHVRVGPREGICRDFAVLGYCAKGLDCDKQHVRECPDFAERGECTTKFCKLPHVIRANRGRKPVSSSAAGPAASTSAGPPSSAHGSKAASSSAVSDSADGTHGASSSHRITAEDGQLGDEFISLTFHESESEESEDEDEEDDEDEDEDEHDEEGQEPHSDNAAIEEDVHE
ncbi:hypothetical protein BD413DRAFT_480613 [Trametes elegans]|nr:hypothetical protein BD413DRAFT_480613 [Trametes elegans]